MHVIGTAGHVDHGKSTLVEALTGIDPDRLAEEKEREMTIDLGFAWLRLGEEEIGIVDVPGHRDFIENMLAGVGGIDLAILVIAADEGVMPQTREHLAILDLLGIGGGIVALTKIDLVEDPDWLELVTLDVAEAVAKTVLADAPIVPVSATKGTGLDTLKSTLQARLAECPVRPNNGRPRLPVDRVFTLPGFGTIVTGTLLDGNLKVGDPIEVHPGGRKARIRGLQTHKRKLERAEPGSRVAINLAGLDRQDLRRGDVVAAPGILGDTILFDAAYRHLEACDSPLKHNVEVKLFVGAAEVLARTRVMGTRHISPGEAGWLQLAVTEPVAVARGDRFILRRPSPSATLGGGRVLDAHPGRRHRRFRPETVQRLQTLSSGTPAELLQQALARIEPASEAAVLKQSGLDQDLAAQTLGAALEDRAIVRIGAQLMTGGKYRRLTDQMVTATAGYCREYPLRLGVPREELRSRLGLDPGIFNGLLAEQVQEGALVVQGTFVSTPLHEIRFSAAQQARINSLFQQLERLGVNSPSVKECKAAVGEDVYRSLVELGRLRQLNEDVVYGASEFDRLSGRIIAHLRTNGRINAAEVRDLLGTSRKYAIALLEHLDDIRITRRTGDYRTLI